MATTTPVTTAYVKQATWNDIALKQINGVTAVGDDTATALVDESVLGYVPTSMTFAGINNAVLTNLQDKEYTLKQQIASLGPNPTTQDLLVLQQKTQEWGMLADLQGTLAKTTAETMKGVIQKVN